MSASIPAQPSAADVSTVVVFQQDWKLYQKMIENNFLFHREAYDRLHCFLADEVNRPFRFLDIACGDASASAGALRGTQIAHYRGIDFSGAALQLAGRALKELACPVVLEERDFLDAVAAHAELADIAWMGLSLHHLLAPAKLALMREIRGVLAKDGYFLIYENTRPNGEDREAWLRRWDAQKAAWSAYTEDEWNAMSGHVHAADFPETDATWHALGREAGFAKVRELFAAPSDLFRLYCFAA